MNLISWNTQGAVSRKFQRVLGLICQQYKPDAVALLEPRVSGSTADKIIKKSRFPYSFRVEAAGFSGGNMATLEGGSGAERHLLP